MDLGYDPDEPGVILDSRDPEFNRGAQIGMLYGVLASHPDDPVTCVVSRSNVENALRITKALGRPFHTTGNECSSGCHLEFEFEASQTVSP